MPSNCPGAFTHKGQIIKLWAGPEDPLREAAAAGRYTQRALTHAHAARKAAEARGGTRPGGLTGKEAQGRAPDVTLFHWLIPAGSPRDREPREVLHSVHPQGRGSTGAVEGASGGAQKRANRSAQDCFFKARYRTVYIPCHRFSKKERKSSYMLWSHMRSRSGPTPPRENDYI